ncbi:MAG: hypothetical protein KAT77_05625 [Nanoarchaeota archaeon]|nr:hypothetical protein [Nanoarchaeota archaeon]
MNKIKYERFENIIIENGLMRVARSPHKLKIPVLDSDLAYLTGYHLGDGYLEDIEKTYGRGEQNYEITYGDFDLEQIKLVSLIIKDKFDFNLRVFKRKNTNMWVGKAGSCKVLHWFLNKQLKIPMGKKNIISIPGWILSDRYFMSNFLSGFFDAEADISKTINRVVNDKRYFKIRFQLTQKDRTILEEIKEILKGRYSIKSDIQRKWNQDVFILRFVGKKSSLIFQKKINFRNPTKRKKLDLLLRD